MDSDSYSNTRLSNASTLGGVQHGAGNNPSTAAGILVIACVVGLSLVRRSFRRYL